MKKLEILLVVLIAFLMMVGCTNTNGGSNKESEQKDSTIVEEPEPKVLSAESIYNNTISKVAMIISYKDGIPYSQGSGFFIDKNTLVTNYHCVEGADKIDFKVTDNDEIYKGAIVVKASDEYDLAIIQTRQDFPFVRIDSLGKEKIGSKIYAIGNPRGLEGTLSDGILSGKRDDDGIEYLQITAPISPGNSGGPVLNEKGDVIGVATFTFRNSQNLNFAMPIKYISNCTDFVLSKSTTKQHLYTDKDNAISIPKFSIVSQYDPCKAYVSIRNNTEQLIKGITGQILFYDNNGEMYDYKNFNIENTISPKMTKQVELFIGDDRIHPGQYWGVPFKMNYRLSGTPKTGIFKFTYINNDNEYINNAKSIEIRILYYELED